MASDDSADKKVLILAKGKMVSVTAKIRDILKSGPHTTDMIIAALDIKYGLRHKGLTKSVVASLLAYDIRAGRVQRIVWNGARNYRIAHNPETVVMPIKPTPDIIEAISEATGHDPRDGFAKFVYGIAIGTQTQKELS